MLLWKTSWEKVVPVRTTAWRKMSTFKNFHNFCTFFLGIHPQTKHLMIKNFSESISKQAPIECSKKFQDEWYLKLSRSWRGLGTEIWRGENNWIKISPKILAAFTPFCGQRGWKSPVSSCFLWRLKKTNLESWPSCPKKELAKKDLQLMSPGRWAARTIFFSQLLFSLQQKHSLRRGRPAADKWWKVNR